ncbi:GA-binding protein subunit beta-1-like [Sarcoptes scabiei]|nr:GA-binding protein subunit beta-1-like [Sarcoptes scabiei]
MFNLKKSLAKLESFLVENNLRNEDKNNELVGTKIPVPEGRVNKEKSIKIPLKEPMKKKIIEKKRKFFADNERGVMMIKNFPHGFYEKEMYKYFSQFGKITRLKIIRSRKTGKPKNYGFIEFRFRDVAKIAAETMNNYLMFDHIVKCSVLEKVHRDVFKNWNRPFVSTVEKHKLKHNEEKTESQDKKTALRHLKKLRKMENILKKSQIEFECVVINKPKNFAPNSKIRKLDESGVTMNKKSFDNFQSMPEERLQIKITKNQLNLLRKRLIIPKFLKLEAGLGL